MLNIFANIGLGTGLILIGYMIVKTFFTIINISDSLRMIARTLEKNKL